MMVLVASMPYLSHPFIDTLLGQRLTPQPFLFILLLLKLSLLLFLLFLFNLLFSDFGHCLLLQSSYGRGWIFSLHLLEYGMIVGYGG